MNSFEPAHHQSLWDCFQGLGMPWNWRRCQKRGSPSASFLMIRSNWRALPTAAYQMWVNQFRTKTTHNITGVHHESHTNLWNPGEDLVLLCCWVGFLGLYWHCKRDPQADGQEHWAMWWFLFVCMRRLYKEQQSPGWQTFCRICLRSDWGQSSKSGIYVWEIWDLQNKASVIVEKHIGGTYQGGGAKTLQNG